jgi:hypothetical protein
MKVPWSSALVAPWTSQGGRHLWKIWPMVRLEQSQLLDEEMTWRLRSLEKPVQSSPRR